MLQAIRKFSSSVYAKIFLFIVAIPFVFWGMGPVFQGGKQNTIAEIGNEKISTQEFVNFVNYNNVKSDILDKNSIEKLLFNFIGKKLVALEIENYNIKLSDVSLSKIIKNQKQFIKNNKFSRIAYEKFLVNKSLNAVSFEQNVSEQMKRNQLFDFIGGGIVPTNFLVKSLYDQVNQKRHIEIINLNDVFRKKMNFSENEIESYFLQNKNEFMDISKSIKFKKLNPENLTGDNEFSDSFFKKIDEIDDLIVEGKNLNFILNQFNLETAQSATFNKFDKDNNSAINISFPKELVKKVFNITEQEPVILIENENKYFIIELTKTETIQKGISDKYVKKEIISNLAKQTTRKLISKIISQINQDNFEKNDFDKLAKDEHITIKKIKLENLNDVSVLKQDLVNQIYSFPKKKVALITDIGFLENFLIYIYKVENVEIEETSEDYKKYFNLSRTKITNGLYNTYENYLKNKYEININYQALSKVKNYF